MTDIKKGDRVKVTTEVEILSPEAVRVNTLGNGAVYGYRALFKGIEVVVPTDATIEKIEPPVEVFKPGDVVRARGARDYIYGLTQDGYVYLAPVNLGLHVPYGASAFQKDEFTSRKYERVSP